MEIEKLIEKRKSLGLSRKKLAQIMATHYTPYSESWIEKIELCGERRFSESFYYSYKNAIEQYEMIVRPSI